MKTILVIDDMAIFREPIAATLRLKGFETRVAASGREALVLMTEHKPDLILLDVAMPEMDGLAFMRVLRSNPQYKHIPVILLTAVGVRDHVMEARKLGVQDYLLKSHFSLEELVSRIHRRLSDPPSTTNDFYTRQTKDTAILHAQPAASGRNSPEPPARPAAQRMSPADPVSKVAPPPPASPALPASPNVQNNQPSTVERIKTLSDLKPTISKKDLIHLVTQGLKLKPLAPVVQNVMSATARAGCSAEDVAKAVAQDQALSIRVLKLANGSTYSRGRTVDNIKDAVGRLGSREIRDMVMTLEVMQQYTGKIADYLDARLFWEHSIACGLIAANIARKCNMANADDLFLWGLLHDVGRLILIEHVPDKYAEVWETAQKQGLPPDAVESKLLMLDHGSILGKALEHWRFPREFVVPVVNHHLTAAKLKRLGPSYVQGATVVALGDRLSKAFLLGNSGNNTLYPIQELVEMLGVQPKLIQNLEETIEQETNNMRLQLLTRMNHETWPDSVGLIREQLPDDLQPIFVSAEPAFDPFRIFFQRALDTSENTPANLGILYITDARNWLTLFKQYEKKEQEAGNGQLPLMIILDKGQIEDDSKLLKDRLYTVLRTPVRIEILIDTCKDLLQNLTCAQQ